MLDLICASSTSSYVVQIAVLFQEALLTIYSSILSQHLQIGNFPVAVQKVSMPLAQAALALHSKVSSTFLPTAIKFHYIFNLRDLSNIFQVSKNLILQVPLVYYSTSLWC